MPELPEVETVRRELEKTLLGKTLLSPSVYYEKMIHSDLDDFLRNTDHQKVLSVDRKGKFLLLNLSNGRRLLFHLRMEGKLFVVDKENHSLSHLSLFFPFENENLGLAFYDVRKFGIAMLLKEGEEGPLSKLGPEPSMVSDSSYLYDKIHQKQKCIKELLLDQSILSGIGNIYDSEILFRSEVSPFKKGTDVTKEECHRILDNSKKVLDEAIENNGSTIRSYQASQKVHGQFQEFLNVYQNTGCCKKCHKVKIQKISLGGRGTYFCSRCQHTGISIGITGKIGSGKSLATSFFREIGYLTISADDIVHSLYQDEKFLRLLKESFPMVFSGNVLSKKKISRLLSEDAAFRKRYEAFVFREVRNQIEAFLIENDGKDKAVEVPLLFDSHMEDLFTFTIGVETTHQEEHLKERGDKDIRQRISFNSLNSYDRNREKLSFILHADSTKEYLKEQVLTVDKKIKEILS